MTRLPWRFQSGVYRIIGRPDSVDRQHCRKRANAMMSNLIAHLLGVVGAGGITGVGDQRRHHDVGTRSVGRWRKRDGRDVGGK
jgi:hypothetical protein